MARASNTVDEAIDRQERDREQAGTRLIDLRLDFELDGETLLSVGDRWDRKLEDFDGEADNAVVVRIHPGQRKAVEWFAAWLDAHDDRRDTPPTITTEDLDKFEIDTAPEHAYSALFAGGRRGGKTWIACALAVAYAIRYPNAIVWLVSPNEGKADELRRYIGGTLAPEWIDHETIADGWQLCNGSVLLLKGAYHADGLKEGRADLVMLNEAQQMTRRAFVVARGAIVDRAGCVLCCANPPVEKKDQTWVADFAADAAAGTRAAVFLDFNPLLNPHIDRGALLALKTEVDERTFAIEVLGQFRGPADAVAWNWIRLENEKPVPEGLQDVTGMFLASIGEGPGIEQVIGLDVQRHPHIGGPVYRFFGDPTREGVIAWIVGEVVLEGGDEIDWCDELREQSYLPSSTLIVCDASGAYQHSRRRKVDSPPTEWKGRGSFSLIQGEGYTRIVPPDRRRKSNPEILDRARAFTSQIASAVGVRRLFADPMLAPKTCASIRDWRTVHGTPSRSQDAAHLGDAASYPIVRLFPRTVRSRKTKGNDPVASKVDLRPVEDSTGAAALRITPPTRGPTKGRRGDRFRGI